MEMPAPIHGQIIFSLFLISKFTPCNFYFFIRKTAFFRGDETENT